MTDYRKNHFVPVWYQERFIPVAAKERKFYYLDLRPEVVSTGRKRFERNSLLRWGPKSCFWEHDLYTTTFGEHISTEIEQKFFGQLDSSAGAALDYFADFEHPSVNGELFRNFVLYMSIQKLRTPKGLAYLRFLSGQNDKNKLLFELQRLQQLFCAIWTECVWTIADASRSTIKFLISDHPVTVYNMGCFPGSRTCRTEGDPAIWLSGTQTIYPLSLDKVLLLTNLSWVRYPYGNPLRSRPNPNPLRPAMFKFTDIQTGRQLSEREVDEINFIIKTRARRYIAAAERSWLFPEHRLGRVPWERPGRQYLLMPDPRSVNFSDEILIGFENGGSDAFDAYGRKPWQQDYKDGARHAQEWETFHAFQGEFARIFGPTRRGRSFNFCRLDPEEDSLDFHRYHLGLELTNKKHRYGTK